MEQCGRRHIVVRLRAERGERPLIATDERLWALLSELRAGTTPYDLSLKTGIDPWFTERFARLVAMERRLLAEELTPTLLREAKRLGFGDSQLAAHWGVDADVVRAARQAAARHHEAALLVQDGVGAGIDLVLVHLRPLGQEARPRADPLTSRRRSPGRRGGPRRPAGSARWRRRGRCAPSPAGRRGRPP